MSARPRPRRATRRVRAAPSTPSSRSLKKTTSGKKRKKSSVIAHLERPAEAGQGLELIADYAKDFTIKSEEAYTTARYCLMDTLGCGFEALEYPACTKLMGPIVQGTVVPNGARVPGKQFQIDPVQDAFNIGEMIRWLDYNDHW